MGSKIPLDRVFEPPTPPEAQAPLPDALNDVVKAAQHRLETYQSRLEQRGVDGVPSTPQGTLGRAPSASAAVREAQGAAIRQAAADIAAAAFAAGEEARKERERLMAMQTAAQLVAAQQQAVQVPASPTQQFNTLFEHELRQRQQQMLSGQLTAAQVQEQVRVVVRARRRDAVHCCPTNRRCRLHSMRSRWHRSRSSCCK